MFSERKYEAAQSGLHFGQVKGIRQSFFQQERSRQPRLTTLVGAMSISLLLNACDSNENNKPTSAVTQSDSAWKTEIAQRRAKIEETINKDRVGFEAFDTGSLGDATLEMIPYVVFRVLQELEPTVFGDEALKSFGFFERKDVPSGLNGITWTRPIAPIDPKIGGFELRYFTRTCASCHTGRIRLEDGKTRILHGSANTEIRLHRFVGQLTEVLKARLADSNDSP